MATSQRAPRSRISTLTNLTNYHAARGAMPRTCSCGGIVETERLELLLKIIAEELYQARQDRTLSDRTADVTYEDELFREGALANIELLRREAGL